MPLIGHATLFAPPSSRLRWVLDKAGKTQINPTEIKKVAGGGEGGYCGGGFWAGNDPKVGVSTAKIDGVEATNIISKPD